MRVRAAGGEHVGPVVDLRGSDVRPQELAAAVRDPDDDRVRCPPPEATAVHRRVGCIRPDMTLDRQGALAAVARSHGTTAAVDDELAAVEADLEALDAGSTDLAAARERVATAGAERDRLRERVATLRGEIRARREAGLDATDAADDLSDAARRLSEATTERQAAIQALDRARANARNAYDDRERRLRLEDRAANLRRTARTELADAVRQDVSDALPTVSDRPLAETSDPLVALAAARIAKLHAPVVVAVDLFGPEATAGYVRAPTVRL